MPHPVPRKPKPPTDDAVVVALAATHAELAAHVAAALALLRSRRAA